jgi:demethylspheroidene O-methyltransferase
MKPALGWRERWLGLRDRLLASPRFQSWAASFPLTRPIARRRARALFDLCAGFVYSQILLACVQLRLFEILAEGPQDLPALAARLALSETAALRLLRAAETLHLVERRDLGRYGLGNQGAALLGNPGIAAMIEHHAMLYADMADPVALLRGERPETALGRYWPYAGAHQPSQLGGEEVAGYTTLMDASQGFIAGDVLDAYSLKRHRRLLDVAGGEGAFLCAAAHRWSHLRVVLFDLPAVAERARLRFEREGLAERAQAVGGDVMRDPLPSGADVASLVRVIHDHNDEAALTILRAVRQALPPDGTLLIAEPMSGTPGAEPVGDAYFGFYLLAMGSGRPRTASELREMLGEAGFNQVREVAARRPILTRVMVARTSRANV